MPRYTRQLENGNLRQRSDAIAGLLQLVPERDDDAIPPTFLSDTLPVLARVARHDPASDLRSGAMEVIGLLGPRAGSAVPALAAGLSDSVPAVRESAALMLGLMGAPGKRAVPALRRALQDASPRVRQHAAASLGSLGAQEADDDLRRALSDSDPYVRRQAQAALDVLRLKRLGQE